jgi:D-alanyl-D-alanine carboxypeptidase/D-alanyl-D-alanine-endopeptidase (penicillin-binding protein 4)
VTRRPRLAALVLTAAACATACAAGRAEPPPELRLRASRPNPADSTLAGDLDRIFDADILARALVGVKVASLKDGRVLYTREAARHVVPASNMKLVTVAVAADRLGWDFRYRTRLEAAGVIEGGTLLGDLIVTGDGDPTIGSNGPGLAPLFLEWADAVARAGIRRVAGRLVGDDNAFNDEGLGAGWAWDYLGAGYATPSGALTYSENIVTIQIIPGGSVGAPAAIKGAPLGHPLDIVNEVTTGPAGSAISLDLLRLPDRPRLTVRGSIPSTGAPVVRTAAVPNPTGFFLEAFKLALADRGITIGGGAWDIDDLPSPPAGSRTALAHRESAPLSSIAAHTLKVSQNLYGETLLKTLGRGAGQPGSAARGRNVVADRLAAWGIAPDSIVMLDGSGLSRYNYVTADALIDLLVHVWRDERLRGPFVAALPVGGHDGTLDQRMKNSILDRRVQAKTGTIANVRALSGYLDTMSGEKLVFSMVANHFTASSTAIDAVMERALDRLVREP